jgi:uncharacterized membrane protein
MAEHVRELPSDRPPDGGRGWRFVGQELWEHLPVYFNVFGTLTVVALAMLYCTPPWRVLTATALLPLLWVLLFIHARYSTDPRAAGSAKPVLLHAVSIAVVLIGLNVFLEPVWDFNVIEPVTKFYPRAVVTDAAEITDGSGAVLFRKGEMITAPDGRHYKVEGRKLVHLEHKRKIVLGLEIFSILWAVLLMVHCLRWRGRGGLVKFFVAAALYGILLEVSGVTLDYFRENDYHFYLPLFAAPVATMVGWSTVFYPSVVVFEMLGRRWPTLRSMHVLPGGLLIALIALSGDLHLDPVATRLGLWTWHERLPDWHLGVPLVNFTSWLTAVFTFGVGYLYIHRRADWSERKKVAAMFVQIPIVQVAGGLINLLLCGLIEGFDGPVWQVLGLNIVKVLAALGRG